MRSVFSWALVLSGAFSLLTGFVPRACQAQSEGVSANSYDLPIGALEMVAGGAGALLSLGQISQSGGSIAELIERGTERLAQKAALERLPAVAELVEESRRIECELWFLVKIRAPNEIPEVTSAIAALEEQFGSLAAQFATYRSQWDLVLAEERARVAIRMGRSADEEHALHAITRVQWQNRAGLLGSLYFVYDGFVRIAAHLGGQDAGLAPGIAYAGPILTQLIRESLNPPPIPLRSDKP